MLVRNTSSSAQQQQQEEEEEQSSSINNNCTSTYLWCRYIINREEKTKSKREPFFHKAFAKRCGTSAGNFCKERGDDVSKMQNKLSLIFSPRSSSHSNCARRDATTTYYSRKSRKCSCSYIRYVRIFQPPAGSSCVTMLSFCCSSGRGMPHVRTQQHDDEYTRGYHTTRSRAENANTFFPSHERVCEAVE